jgi:hypothetical protein
MGPVAVVPPILFSRFRLSRDPELARELNGETTWKKTKEGVADPFGKQKKGQPFGRQEDY